MVDHAAVVGAFHDLRHSYATWLVTDGVPVNIVQKAMGHDQDADGEGARDQAVQVWSPGDLNP